MQARKKCMNEKGSKNNSLGPKEGACWQGKIDIVQNFEEKGDGNHHIVECRKKIVT
jgi:hypothetical protein